MIGQTISHYKILEKLGEGGMGVVYRAHDTMLDRDVALKFISSDLSSSADYRSRFLREARAASALDHPNICTIFEVGETQEHRMFLVMALYKGETLQQKIDSGLLSFDEALNIGVQTVLGLQAAHEQGILHRDIKSGNIMITSGGAVKILDFGLAKVSGQTQITGGTVKAGTLAFMSPEQVRGMDADKRSDIWSLGAVLYHIFTGRLPFSATYDQALVYAILNETPIRPSVLRHDIPKFIDEIILRCLSRNPSDRYQSANDIADDLLRISRKKTRQVVSRTLKKRINRTLVSAAIILVLVILYLFRSSLSGYKQVQENAVVVDVNWADKESSGNHDMTSDMVEFLIADEVLQSTNKEVFRWAEFQQLYPGKNSALSLTVSVRNQEVGYNIDVAVNRPDQSAPMDTVFNVHDRSALLTEVLPEIRKRLILSRILGDWKPSYLTNNWDAFVRFYYGLRQWTHLEITKAQENFNAAIAIDPQFVLAKLRLAEVYTFGESRVLAESLLRSVRPAIGLLSRIDSLRAEAIGAFIVRDFRKEVAIRRDIYQMYPLRKESAFDVAEAYFWLCEIPDAISYYKIAINLDSNFARAYNHLGYCYSHLGDHDSALYVIRKYLSLDSTANAYDSMGDCFMAAGYEDSAMLAKSRGITVDPKLWYLYWTSTFVRLRQGRLDDADSVAATYMQYVYSPDLRARGYTNKAFVAYERKDYRAAMKYCKKALQIFDSPDLGTRNPELHWLHSLVGLELNDMNVVTNEMNQMEQIIHDHNINATNYQMYFYKYYRHLRACVAARKNDIAGVIDVAQELDGPLRLKVRDHTSPFDYAFLSTALGELFALPPLSRSDFAIERFNCALQYNPRYAPAHYNLWKIYIQKGDTDKAERELRMVRHLWKDADARFLKIYGIPEG